MTKVDLAKWNVQAAGTATSHDVILDHLDEIERLEAALQDSIAEITRLRTALTRISDIDDHITAPIADIALEQTK